jgi:hypothetical protein
MSAPADNGAQVLTEDLSLAVWLDDFLRASSLADPPDAGFGQACALQPASAPDAPVAGGCTNHLPVMQSIPNPIRWGPLRMHLVSCRPTSSCRPLGNHSWQFLTCRQSNRACHYQLSTILMVKHVMFAFLWRAFRREVNVLSIYRREASDREVFYVELSGRRQSRVCRATISIL